MCLPFFLRIFPVRCSMTSKKPINPSPTKPRRIWMTMRCFANVTILCTNNQYLHVWRSESLSSTLLTSVWIHNTTPTTENLQNSLYCWTVSIEISCNISPWIAVQEEIYNTPSEISAERLTHVAESTEISENVNQKHLPIANLEERYL